VTSEGKVNGSTVEVGDDIPEWTMAEVDPQRMKTMAAILRDPYPVHWDRIANEAFGLGGRVINQGPLNLSYIANMLMAWAGPTCVRRLTVSFGRPVLDGDRVTAKGSVVALEDHEGELRATCEVRLERDGEIVVSGTAVVAISSP
jgi:acyl dehydratase